MRPLKVLFFPDSWSRPGFHARVQGSEVSRKEQGCWGGARPSPHWILGVERCNGIGAAGAWSLAGVLGQCSSLTRLDLEGNDMGVHGLALIRISWI